MTYNDTKSSIYKLKISKKNLLFCHHLSAIFVLEFFKKSGIFRWNHVGHDIAEIKMMLDVDTGIGNAIKMDSKWLNLVHLIIIMILVDFAADSVT